MMFRKRLSMPTDEDKLCDLLNKHAYTNIDEFRDAYVNFALMIDPDMKNHVDIESPRLQPCIAELRAQLNQAETFLKSAKLDAIESNIFENAMNALTTTINKADQRKTVNR